MDSKNAKLLQKHLVERLANPELDRSLLKDSSLFIAQAYGKGIKWDDVFPLGIKVPDAIGVRGRVPISNVGRLRGLFGSRYLTSIEIFPRGIISPEYLEVLATFSNNRHRRM